MRTHIPVPVLRSADHLLAAIPFLLGFRPQASVVVVWIDAGSIALTQRVDWPPACDEDCPLDDARLGDWAGAVAHAARHVRAQAAVLICYPARHAEVLGEGAGSLAALARSIQAVNVEVLDALVVLDQGWCRLDGGLPVTTEALRPFDLQITAEVSDDFMYAGWSFAADRAQVSGEFAREQQSPSVPSVELDSLLAGVASLDEPSLERWREDRVQQLVDACENGLARSSDSAQLAAGLHDIRVRDALLWHLAQELDPDTGMRLMRRLVRELPEGRRSPAATVAGICAWLAGDGVRANAALELALVDDPEYGLARLVSTALSNGLPPSMWRETMSQLSYADCRFGLR